MNIMSSVKLHYIDNIQTKTLKLLIGNTVQGRKRYLRSVFMLLLIYSLISKKGRIARLNMNRQGKCE